jgi:ketosteroid isomerase-like protein
MRRTILAVLACTLVLAAARAAAEDGAKQVDTAWLKAIKANDVDALVACYAPDAVLWLPDAPEARGEKAIRATYAGLLAANTVVDASLSNVVYNTGGRNTEGEISTSWGNFTLVLKPKAGGANVVMKGRFLSASRPQGGRWRYIAAHASAEPSPPPSSAPAAK